MLKVLYQLVAEPQALMLRFTKGYETPERARATITTEVIEGRKTPPEAVRDLQYTGVLTGELDIPTSQLYGLAAGDLSLSEYRSQVPQDANPEDHVYAAAVTGIVRHTQKLHTAMLAGNISSGQGYRQIFRHFSAITPETQRLEELQQQSEHHEVPVVARLGDSPEDQVFQRVLDGEIHIGQAISILHRKGLYRKELFFEENGSKTPRQLLMELALSGYMPSFRSSRAEGTFPEPLVYHAAVTGVLHRVQQVHKLMLDGSNWPKRSHFLIYSSLDIATPQMNAEAEQEMEEYDEQLWRERQVREAANPPLPPPTEEQILASRVEWALQRVASRNLSPAEGAAELEIVSWQSTHADDGFQR